MYALAAFLQVADISILQIWWCVPLEIPPQFFFYLGSIQRGIDLTIAVLCEDLQVIAFLFHVIKLIVLEEVQSIFFCLSLDRHCQSSLFFTRPLQKEKKPYCYFTAQVLLSAFISFEKLRRPYCRPAYKKSSSFGIPI